MYSTSENRRGHRQTVESDKGIGVRILNSRPVVRLSSCNEMLPTAMPYYLIENLFGMKSWWVASATALLLFLTSSYPIGSHDSVLGKQAPEFGFTGKGGFKVETPALRGKVLVVSFWRLSDAQSRIDNILYQKAVAAKGSDKLRFISVNLDEDSELAEQVACADGIAKESMFNIKDAVLGNVEEDYALQQGCRTYVIDANGVVAAVNPEKTDFLNAVN